MKRLKRSRSNRVFSGVFAGLGEFFAIDATILRIVYVIFSFSNPFYSLIIYGLASVIIPEDDGVIYQDHSYDSRTNDNSRIFIGIGLILLGALLLARMYIPNFNLIFPSFRYIIRRIVDFWPVLLIVLGFYVIFNQKKNY